MKSVHPDSLKPYFKGGAILAGALLLFCTLFILSVRAGFFGPVPSLQELREIPHHEATQIRAADGTVIGSFFHQNRITVSLDDVSPFVTDALIATEDIRFYRHRGIDYRALARVVVKTILLRQDAGGGSTLSQQLVKNIYPRESGRGFGLVTEKIREMIVARRIEMIYSKDEILEMYLNTVSFGENTYGIERAAKRFFNKSPAQLELHEAATLTGVLRATTWYNPRRNPGRALHRRNVVLGQMEKYGMITPEEREDAGSLPLSIDDDLLTDNRPAAPYFREQLRRVTEQILDSLEIMNGFRYDLHTDGLTIETTLHPAIQRAAEYAVSVHLKDLQEILDRQQQEQPFFGDEDELILRMWRNSSHYRSLIRDGVSGEEIQKILHDPVPMQLFSWNGPEIRETSPYDSLRQSLSFLNAGFLAMEPETGEILAWVGGIDHSYFQFDHVTSRRQTGSAFKPVVYAAALEHGLQPCGYHRNQLTTYSDYDEWTPRNVSDDYGGYYSLQGALSHSINTITIDLLLETGIEPVRKMAHQMGLRSWIPDTPSIALGTAEASLLDLTQAYALFANRGYSVEPRLIRAIYDASGREIYRSASSTDSGSSSPVLTEEHAAAMIRMLSNAVDEGTSKPLRDRFGIRGALAGKTGTTQGYTDGWFIGITPDMVFGTWVGGPVSRVRFRDENGYASRTALPVAGYFLQTLQQDPGYPEFPDQFHPQQWETNRNFTCPDYRDERLLDRARDFFTGTDPESPRRVGREKEKNGSLLNRIRGLFNRD